MLFGIKSCIDYAFGLTLAAEARYFYRAQIFPQGHFTLWSTRNRFVKLIMDICLTDFTELSRVLFNFK